MPEPTVHPNPRRHRRLEVRMNVTISTIDAEIDPVTGRPYFRTSEETCANVSRGGAFVATPEPLTPGRRLLVELDIPGGGCVQTIGRVAWAKAVVSPSGASEGSGIGVEFIGGATEQFAALEDFLTRSARRARRQQDSPRPSLSTPGRRA